LNLLSEEVCIVVEIPRRRVILVLVAFLVFMGAVGWRLVTFQVLRGADLSEEALDERFGDRVVAAQRGTIYDRNGAILASTIPADRLEVDLTQVKASEDSMLARVLAAPLMMSPSAILDILQGAREADRNWVQVKTRLSPEQSQQVRDLKLRCMEGDSPCLYLRPEPKRVYPNGDFASQLIGFTNWQLEGEYGVEASYDEAIGGTPGRVRAEYDVFGNLIAIGEHSLESPTDGLDVTLTIDAAVQRTAERQLEEAIRANGAAGGTVIVMDVQTGAIVALANRPSFDPNTYGDYNLAVFNNPAVSSLYEPGSTMKVITMAIGLETGAVHANTVFYDDPGYIMIDRYKITNLNGVSYGSETMSEILQHSSNLGSVFVAGRTGADKFYGKLRDFGIGAPTGIDLPGEEAGIVNWPENPYWRPINLSTNAYGQGITVTPIQMITAVAACVNGGRLMQPYVVSELRQEGQVVRRNDPKVVRQVLRPEVSRQIVGMMTDVVDNVSFPHVGIPGYAVGSKSGTAQIPAAGGGYEPDDQTIGSLIGIGPSEQPRFAVLVKIDRPKNERLGSVTSGPPTRQILLELFTLYAIPPTRREGR
jgi:cell division protein FtsI (penicillin-binding protein 3)